MIRRIKILGITVLEVESDDADQGAPDFTSNAHQAGFINTRITPPKPDEE